MTKFLNYLALSILAIFTFTLASCGGGGGGGGPVVALIDQNIDTVDPIEINEGKTGKDTSESGVEQKPPVEPEEVVEEATTSPRPAPISDTMFFTELQKKKQPLISGNIMPGETYNVERIDTRTTQSTAPLAAKVGYSTSDKLTGEIRQSSTSSFRLLPDGSEPDRYISPKVQFVSTNPYAQSFEVDKDGGASFITRNHHIRGETQGASTYRFNINEHNPVATEIAPAGHQPDDTFKIRLFSFDKDKHSDSEFSHYYGYVSLASIGRRAAVDGYAYKEYDLVDVSFIQTSVGETPRGNLPSTSVEYDGFFRAYFSLPHEDKTLINQLQNYLDDGGEVGTYRNPFETIDGEFDMEVNFATGDINAEFTQTSDGEWHGEYYGVQYRNRDKVIGNYRGYIDELNTSGSTFLGKYTSAGNLGYTLEDFGIYGGFYGPNAEEISALGMGDYVVDDDYVARWGEQKNGRAIMALLGQKNSLNSLEFNIDFLDGLKMNKYIIHPDINPDGYLAPSDRRRNVESLAGQEYKSRRNNNFDMVTTRSVGGFSIGIKESGWPELSFGKTYSVQYGTGVETGQTYRFAPITQRENESLGNILTTLRRDEIFGKNALADNYRLGFFNTDNLFTDGENSEYRHARFTILSLIDSPNPVVTGTSKKDIFAENIDYKEFNFLQSSENAVAADYDLRSNFLSFIATYEGDSIIVYSQGDETVDSSNFNFGKFGFGINFNNNKITGQVCDIGSTNVCNKQGDITGTFANNAFTGKYVSQSAGNPDLDLRGGFYGDNLEEVSAIGHGEDETGKTGIIGLVGKKECQVGCYQ